MNVVAVKEIIKELNMSVAYLLDNDSLITAEVKDIEHIKNLMTELENEIERNVCR